MLKHLDLFSGIGGFSLGLESAGLVETVAFCDFDQYCQKVLKKNFPGVPVYGDVKELNYEKLQADGINKIDIITGGYPCQPFSVAGRKKGEEDPRHVWPEMFRLIRELRPTWVIGENVGGHIKLGLDSVLENLESEGYSARTFSISASSIGANHKRERVWIVAHSDEMQRQFLRGQKSEQTQETFQGTSERSGTPISMADTERLGRTEGTSQSEKLEREESSDQSDHCGEGCTKCQSCQTVANSEGSEGNVNDSNGGNGKAPQEELFGEHGSARGVGTWWSVEPELGGRLDGLSTWMDGLDMTVVHELLSANGEDNKRARKEMFALWSSDETKKIWEKIRGSIHISTQEILFTYLCQLKKKATEQKWLQLASKETSKKELRSMWDQYFTACASHRSEQSEQQSIEYPNFMQTLSRLLAQYAEKAWIKYCRENAISYNWEEGISRIAHGIPDRVDRLKCLGNSVVPQIPYVIGLSLKKIIENNEQSIRND